MNGFAVLDLETTGLRPTGDRVIEVSLVLYDVHGREETTYTSLVNPEAPIPVVASSINGITDEMVAAAPCFRDLADHLAALTTGRVLVGHNIAGFDRNFLTAEFSRSGITWEPYGLLDTLRLARIAYPGLKTHKLGTLCELAGIVNTHAHRAESDARAAWQLLCTIAADDVDDLTDLDRYELPTFTSAMPAQLVARRPVKRAPDPDLLQSCAGETVTFTGGKPDGFASREEARDAVLARGGAVSNSVTQKTTLVFVGDNAGSKLDRARELGVTIAPHSSFAAFLNSGRPALGNIEAPVIRRYDGREDVAGPKSSAPVAPADHGTPPAANVADGEDLQGPSTQRVRVRAADTTPNTSMEVSTRAATVSGERELGDGLTGSKGMVIFLAVVFGAFGAHRFYLGDHHRGRLMAVVSIATLGVLAPVMAVLGLVDAYRIWHGGLRRSR